jgi:hypothetical protein
MERRFKMAGWVAVASLVMTGALAAQGNAPSENRKQGSAIEVPKDAVLVRPGFWQWSDAKGNKWIFKQTPFGIVKDADRPPDETERTRVEIPSDVTVAELKDGTLAFSKKTPFGLNTWTKKKTDLDDEERVVWEREQVRRQTAAAAAKK